MDTATKTQIPTVSRSIGITPTAKARKIALRGIRAISNMKLVFIFGSLASITAAVGLSQVFAKKLWESSGTLLYTPLTTAESTASMYVPPDLKTLVSIAKEPTTLEAIATEFKLKTPIKTLAAVFEVIAPNGTKTIEIKLKWGNDKIGAAMVNRLMEIFRNAVLDIRLRKIADYAKSFEVNNQQSSERYQASLKTMQDFNHTVTSVDIGREISLMSEALLELQAEMGRVRRSELSYGIQAKELDKYVTNMRQKEEKEGEVNKQFEAADETIADNRRRQDRLREMVTDERSRLETEALLVAKRGEHRRMSRLAKDSYASQEDLERVSAEIGVLTAKIVDNARIIDWKKELDRIDQVVVPKGKSKSQGSPIVQQALTKRLEIDLILRGDREQVRDLEVEIADKRQRINQLLSMQLKYQALTKEIESAELEKMAASAGLRDMRRLQAMRVPDLVVVTPATPSPYPTSNRKTLLIGIMMGGLLLTIGFILVVDHRNSDGPSSESVVAGLGLPMLELFTDLPYDLSSLHDFNAGESVQLRLLALRLRQAIRTPTALCLFSTINESAGSAWLVVPLALCLARRDERVLIIDTAGLGDDGRRLAMLIDPTVKEKEQPGLSGYLSFLEDDLGSVIVPTTIAAVDCLPCGSSPIKADSLATYRMSELLDLVRDQYTMILVLGPRADHQVDLEILSSRADGILFLANDQSGRCLKLLPNIKTLASLGAPILGAVLVEATQIKRPIPKRIPSNIERKLDKSQA